jgi:electron transfer flavoprotein beta subunit
MKILVPVKRTVDPNVRVRIRPDGSGVETRNLKAVMNPFCEIAVEEAVRLKEAGKASGIIVVTIASRVAEDILRNALAMGADRALLIETDQALQPLAVAKILRELVTRESPDLVMLGKQAVDDDNNQTGQMLAGLLGWPQGTFASSVKPEAGSVIVTREVDEGLERLALTLPAVVTTDLRLNQPRYLSLPNIMKAKKLPIERLALDDLGIDTKSRQTTLGVAEPATRGGCEKVASVDELLDRLRNVARVI